MRCSGITRTTFTDGNPENAKCLPTVTRQDHTTDPWMDINSEFNSKAVRPLLPTRHESSVFPHRARMKQLTPLIFLLLAGCRLITGNDISFAGGSYFLETVDGQTLPVTLPNQGNCPLTMTDGDFGLVPEVSYRRPLYAWTVFGKPTCSPPGGGEPIRQKVLQDVGGWDVSFGRIVFKSSREFGTYSVPIEEPLPSGAAGLLTLVIDGHSYAWRRSP